MFSSQEYERAIGRLYMEGLSIQNVLQQLQSTIEAKEQDNIALLKKLDDLSDDK